jgi:hypothetical protein
MTIFTLKINNLHSESEASKNVVAETGKRSKNKIPNKSVAAPKVAPPPRVLPDKPAKPPQMMSALQAASQPIFSKMKPPGLVKRPSFKPGTTQCM